MAGGGKNRQWSDRDGEASSFPIRSGGREDEVGGSVGWDIDFGPEVFDFPSIHVLVQKAVSKFHEQSCLMFCK